MSSSLRVHDVHNAQKGRRDMNKDIKRKVEMLHSSRTKVCLVATGAGSGCQNLISPVVGASSTLLECFLPYSREALADFSWFLNRKNSLQKKHLSRWQRERGEEVWKLRQGKMKMRAMLLAWV